MKFTVNRSALLDALSVVGGVIERRNTIPILGNYLIEAGDGLTVVGTDMDIEVSARCEADVADGGSITVPASLRDVVAKLPDGDVRAELAGDRLVVSAGRSRFTLPTIPASDFPRMEACKAEKRIPGFAAALDAVKFAASTEEVRYYLNGVYVHADAGRLNVVATDGHRLAVTSIASDADGGVIIPRKTVELITKLGEGFVGWSDTKISYTAGEVSIVSKVIDGRFPDYSRVIPSGGEPCVVSAEELRRAVERVATISAEKVRGVRMRFGREVVELSVRGSESGEGHDVVPVEYGGDVEIGFNGRYLIDALSRIDGDATLHLKTGTDPVLITAGGDARYVVMPLRV